MLAEHLFPKPWALIRSSLIAFITAFRLLDGKVRCWNVAVGTCAHLATRDLVRLGNEAWHTLSILTHSKGVHWD